MKEQTIQILQVLDQELCYDDLCEEDVLKFFIVSGTSTEEFYEGDDDDYVEEECFKAYEMYLGIYHEGWNKRRYTFKTRLEDYYSLITCNVEKFKNGNTKRCILKEMPSTNRHPTNKTRKNVRV